MVSTTASTSSPAFLAKWMPSESPCTSLAAGNGRVDEREASLLRLGVKLARDLGRRGRMVDEHRALLHAVEGAIGPERDFAQVVVVADAAHDEVLALGRRLGRRRAAPAVLAHPFFCLRGGAVVDGQVMATLVLEVACHGVAHDAKTEKSCFRHPVLPRAHCRAPAPMPIWPVIATAWARRQR